MNQLYDKRKTEPIKDFKKMSGYEGNGQAFAKMMGLPLYDEETTDAWTLERCRMQYVKDQLEFIHGGNLDDEIEETWNTVFKKEMV